MRGFIVPIKGSAERTIVHHRERGISSPTNIKDVGVERDFYAVAQEYAIDDEITRRETRYADVVRGLAAGKNFTEHMRVDAIAFVAHLLMSTRRVRRALQDARVRSLALMSEFIEHPQFLNKQIMEIVEGRDPALRSAVTAEAARRKLALDEKQIEFLELLGKRQLFKDRAALKQYVRAQMRSAIASMNSDDGDFSASTHLKILAQSVEPAPRVEDLKKMAWVVRRTEDGALILGDSPVVGFSVSGALVDPLVRQAETDSIVLPLSSNTMLVGCRSSPPRLDVDLINEASARLARDFFVSSQATERTRALLTQVGTSSDFMADSDFEALKTQVISSVVGDEEIEK